VIQVFDLSAKEPTPIPQGIKREVLGSGGDGTRVHVAVYEVDSGESLEVSASDRTRVVYVLDGEGAEIKHKVGPEIETHAAPRRSGVYLEPGEEATVTAAGKPLKLLEVSVPKYDGKPTADPSPSGYFFEEAQLRSLVDEKGIRERTFWVNTETGLSDSWDLQLGRMQYAPEGYSPRHVHDRSETAEVTPEHFYFIESGNGTVKYDGGSLSVGPGHLVLFPAGEWHQLLASGTGLDYIEFQAPFDFATTMDHDPLGKNWYIKGTDDGTGKPELWVQS
jgi:mannose-6-phosphate isomerase-like protein (cupin superfamily)